MVRPADVLAMQGEVIDKLQDWRFAKMFDGYFVDTVEKGRPSKDSKVSQKGYANVARSYLKIAQAYRVESHMNRLIAQNAVDFAEDETGEAYRPPSDSGFCIFEQPLALREISGRHQLLHAIAWCPLPFITEIAGKKTDDRGMLFYAFNDLRREPDEVFVHNREIERKSDRPIDHDFIDSVTGRWSLVCCFPMASSWPLGEALIEAPEHLRQRYDELGMAVATHGADNVRRYMHALWALLSQVLPGAHREPAELDRRARRGAQRLKIKPQVDLVTLRREHQRTEAPGSGLPIGVRYLAQGPNGTGWPRVYHRGTEREYTIWIKPHWRGPKDAPLSMRQKVHNLKR